MPDWLISDTRCSWNSASRSVSVTFVAAGSMFRWLIRGDRSRQRRIQVQLRVDQPRGIHAHWASHSSSETSSGGTVRVLLARMLLMLVKDRRFAMPIRLTPVPSRFTWARCMCFKNLRPEENIKNTQRMFSHVRKDLGISVLVDFRGWPHRGLWSVCGSDWV